MKATLKSITNYLTEYSYMLYLGFWLGTWNVKFVNINLWLFLIPFVALKAVSDYKRKCDLIEKHNDIMADGIEKIMDKHNDLPGLKAELTELCKMLKEKE